MSEKKYGNCPHCNAPCEVIEKMDVQNCDGDIVEIPYDEYSHRPQHGHVWVKEAEFAIEKEHIYCTRSISKGFGFIYHSLFIDINGVRWVDGIVNTSIELEVLDESPTERPVVEIRYGIDKWKYWRAWFCIGVQTFHLQDAESKENAEWYVKMLQKAFSNLTGAAEQPVKPYDDLYRLVFSNLAKLRARTQDNERMISMADNIRDIIEDVTNKMLAMPQTDPVNDPWQLHQSAAEQPGREVEFAEWCDDNYYRKFGVWRHRSNHEEYTTAQLWEIFIKQPPAEWSGEKIPDQKGLEWLYNPHIEFCYRHPDGRVVVRYRRIQGTPECDAMIAEVDKLIEKAKPNVSPYFYRVEGEKEVKPPNELKAGLKFRNVHMPTHSFEVISVTPKVNQLEVRIYSPGGQQWTEKDWVLDHTQWAFEKGEYYVTQPLPKE